MTSPKHTPGPWRVGVNQHGGAHVVSEGADSQLVCETPGGGNCGLQLNELGKAHALSNAKLIAAAPDLAEALQRCLAEIECARAALPEHVSRHYKATLEVAEEMARAALAKAGL